MPSSGEIWILNKLSELANRCGVSPTVAEINLNYHSPEDMSKDVSFLYSLRGIDGAAQTEEEQARVEKVWSLLGLDGTGYRHFESLHELEEIVDQALSRAPRPRIR
jgi:hypothetical protein